MMCYFCCTVSGHSTVVPQCRPMWLLLPQHPNPCVAPVAGCQTQCVLMHVQGNGQWGQLSGTCSAGEWGMGRHMQMLQPPLAALRCSMQTATGQIILSGLLIMPAPAVIEGW